MKFFRNKYVIGFGILVVIIIVIVIAKSRGGAPDFESATVARGSVVETVSVTGTVSPLGEADLAFEKSGTITSINVAVGDTVKQGDPIASLDSAADEANVASEQATLADMERDLTPAELAVQLSQVATASTSLATAQLSASDTFRDAFTLAQGAVLNNIDQFFSNPETNPTINIPITSLSSQNEQNAIDNERGSVSLVLNAWQNNLAAASSTNSTDLLSWANGYLTTLKQFGSDMSAIINALTPGTSGLSQATIAADVATMNTAVSELNTAADNISNAQSGLSSASSGLSEAQSQYDLKLSGNSSDSIASQAAKVAEAQAILDQDTITSPLDGIMTVVTPTVGEFATAGQTLFSVESTAGFKVEAYVPEADIAKVAIGDQASSTLDAYGSDVDFEETVTAIDPAETVLEGVPTYKVTLLFNTNDPRIRSGMTSNLIILTHVADNVLNVPSRAIVDTNGAKSVRVVNADGKTYTSVPVVTGLKGSDGTTEIDSGLTEGEKVVTYVPGQD